MATSLVVNGVSYLYPDTGDQSWGTVASAWAAAVTSGTLQKSGGVFTLTADANFGATFGLVSQYFKSGTTNAASAGQIRLASTDTIKFRNNANAADIALGKDTSDRLTWGGNPIASSAGVVPIGAGGTGQTTQAAGFNALSPLTTKGDLIGFDGSNNIRFAAGADGTVVSYDSAQASGLKAISVLTSPMTTLGDIIYENVSPAAARLAGNTSATLKVLTQTGTGAVSAAPAWNTLNASVIAAGTLATARGGTNLDTSASTGLAKVASGTWSVAAAAASDFGTQTAGTFLAGPTSGSAATPTFRALQVPTVQVFTSGSGTYTTPAGVLYLIVEIVGGGAGGGGSGTTNGTAAGDGVDSTFSVHSGAAILTAGKGLKGARATDGGAGGTATVAAGATKIIASSGGAGGASVTINTVVTAASTYGGGGQGGSSYFGGAGFGGSAGSTGNGGAAGANTGAGGGGAYANASTSSANGGSGGGAGAFIRALVTSPGASYDYVVGGGGAGQLLGANGAAGGAGGSGYLVVTEFYQ